MKLKKAECVVRYLMKHGVQYTIANEWINVPENILAWVNMNVFDQLLAWEYKPAQIKVRDRSREIQRRREKKAPKKKAKKVVQKVVKEPKQKVLQPKPTHEPWKSSKRCIMQQFREVMGNLEIHFVPFELVQKQVAKANKVRKVRTSYKKAPKPKKQGTFNPEKLQAFARKTEKPKQYQRPPAVYSNPNWSAMYQ